VLGNHDEAAYDPSTAENFNDVAKTAIRWTQEQLSEKNLDVLRELGYDFAENGARFVHASPHDPCAWHYILTEQEAWDAFASFEERICFVGHSHVPLRVLLQGGRLVVEESEVLDLAADDRALVNVGSVGQPRDGDWRAAYALYDPDAKRVIARRVEYDRPAASRKILDAGLPEILARRLSVGQ
jgi:diadenosine tetraphosphatase ApaH/serine/threonine PP2A family protein phosphatase